MFSRPRIAASGLLLLSFGLIVRGASYEDEPFGKAHPVPCRGFLLFDKHVECGLFDVPLDWHHPENGQGQIRYVKYPASSNVTRRGTIFLRPGFPFDSKSVAFNEETWFISTAGELHASTNGTFDLVLFDARGTGDADRTFPGTFTCFNNFAEKRAFYLEASTELGIEPAWDDGMAFSRDPTYEDAQDWLVLQTKMVEHCLKKQETTELRYIGTSAVVRDLVSLADYFDGPGSPVNFWGTQHGALIGTYLLYMFPERVGRVVLQALPGPAPSEYTNSDSYKSWLRAVQYAHQVASNLTDECMREDQTSCTAFPDLIDGRAKIYTWIGMIMLSRARFIGWQTTNSLDANDTILASVLSPAALEEAYPDTNLTISRLLDLMQRTTDGIDHLGLGMMPIFCGDHATQYSPEAAVRRNGEIADELKNAIHIAPLFGRSIFPPLSSLCHLWPIRAVEPLTDVANLSAHVAVAYPPLVLQYAYDPFSQPTQSLADLLPGIENASVVTQMYLDVKAVSSETCMGRILLDYLSNGTLPTQSVCYPFKDTDASRSPPLAKPSSFSMTHIAASWSKFSSATLLHTMGSGEVLWMLSAVTLAVFTAVVKKGLKTRRMARNGDAVPSDAQRDTKIVVMLSRTESSV